MVESFDFQPKTIGPNRKLPNLKDIPDGNIFIIRFIRSDRKLNIFNESFQVSKDLIYSYVKAIIVNEIHTLQIYLGDEFVESFEYQMPE